MKCLTLGTSSVEREAFALTIPSHHMYTMMLDNKLFLAPIDPNPQQVLDIGTGTGIWAMFRPPHFSAFERR